MCKLFNKIYSSVYFLQGKFLFSLEFIQDSYFLQTAYTLPKDIPIEIDAKLELKEIKDFKKHHGIIKMKTLNLPEYLENTINKIISGTPFRSFFFV